jgi:hypothetical protein
MTTTKRAKSPVHRSAHNLLVSALLLFAAVIAIVPPALVHAEDRPAIRIGLTPVSLDIAQLAESPLKPNTVYKDEEFTKFVVYNSGAKDFDFKLTVEPYTMSGSNYDTITNTATKHTEISRWISLEKTTYTLKSDERMEVPFTITVPEDAPGGSQYAIIYAEAVDPASTGVVPASRVGIPIHALIGGETREDAAIKDTNIPTFLFAPPITTSSTIKNSGNVDVMPEYVLTVTNIFGQQVHYDKKTFHIQPDTDRTVELAWDGAPLLGVFKVKQEVTFTVNNQPVTDTIEKTVLIIPLAVIIFIPIAGAGLIFLTIRKRKAIKSRYKG